MIVRQVVPRVAARAVILADRTPLPLAHIRSPQIPGAGLAQPLLEPPEPVYPLTFSTHRRSLLPCLPFPGFTGQYNADRAAGPEAVISPAIDRLYIQPGYPATDAGSWPGATGPSSSGSTAHETLSANASCRP